MKTGEWTNFRIYIGYCGQQMAPLGGGSQLKTFLKVRITLPTSYIGRSAEVHTCVVVLSSSSRLGRLDHLYGSNDERNKRNIVYLGHTNQSIAVKEKGSSFAKPSTKEKAALKAFKLTLGVVAQNPKRS
jgi:hypothetical protein